MSLAINTNYVTLPSLMNSSSLNVGFEGEFMIESTEKSLPILTGDDLLLIKPSNSDLIFTNAAVISKEGGKRFVKGTEGNNKSYVNKDKYHHYYSFKVNKALIKNNRLSELEYSLPIIENYNSPKVHFQSQYRILTPKDYETIVNGWVYATRTVFGKLVNALPRQNKLEFMIQAMDHFSTIDFKDTSLLEGLNFLYHYIERRILSRGRLLVATDRIIKKELGDLLNPTEVGFIDPDTNVVNNINKQAIVFEKLFRIEKEMGLKKSLANTIKENSTMEERFQKMFKNKLWPVDLEK